MTLEGPPGSSIETLVFAVDLASAPPRDPATRIVVLDITWTPAPADRQDALPIRRLFGRAVEAADLYEDALTLVDAWADRTGAADALLAEDVTYWFRMRETMWRWLHERLLWRRSLAGLALTEAPRRVGVPAGEDALRDAARAMWPGRVTVAGEPAGASIPGTPADPVAAAAPRRPAARSLPPRLLRRVARGVRRGVAAARRIAGGREAPAGTAPDGLDPRAEREAQLDARIRRLAAGSGRRALVLTNPRTYQRIGLDDRHADPLFGSVIPRLGEIGLEPVLFGSYVDHRTDEGWAVAASDDRLLPQTLLQTRWRHPEDEQRAERALAGIERGLATLAATTLDVDGVDLGPAFIAELASRIRQQVRSDIVTLPRVERLLAELRPSVVLLAQEGIRTPWLIACRAAGIPVLAVQHGVLYPTHPGYPHRPHPALVQPTVTAVYGSYEASVLLDRGAFRADQVAVTGSPRVDLDGPEPDADRAAAERAAVRDALGIPDGDRLLVISTVNLRFVQRSHFAHSVATLLDGPLPGLHVVFKLHPGEFDEGPYRALVEGVARAAGRPLPAVHVVKDIDLYRLLRAADAHLGMLSTVLTDAVIAGTRNLIGMVDRHADLIGYVEAGVARPVRNATEVLTELDRPWAPDPERRSAFLERHARPGDAAGRILALIRDAIGAAGS